VNDSAPKNQPEFACSICSDLGYVIVETELDGRKSSQAKKCECVLRKIAEQKILKIPAEYRSSELSMLVPRPDLHPKQAEYIAMMKANPHGKYILSGDFGTGKTHFFWALYREAVNANRKIYASTLQSLISTYQASIEASQRNETPQILPITADDLRQTDTPYSLFLDDIDKARATEYTAEQLFALIDACYSYGHQTVVTTNLSIDRLIEYFGRADRDFGRFGGAIVRRLLDNAREIEMF
jgi:DNA replication protein DnaC